MDRGFVYPGQVPADTDILFPQRAAVIGLGMLAQAVIGQQSVVFDGLAVGPTSPASMSVSVGAGSLYALVEVDAVSYGSLGTLSSPLVQQAINLNTATVGPLTAPATAGQSVNVLIEATFNVTDSASVLLPYMNAANPSVPYGGPGNNGESQPTRRTVAATLQAKAGVPTTTGSQTTPSADSGYVPIAVVTIACGQSSIVAGNITAVTTNALLSKLGDVLQASGSLTDASAALASSGWVQALLGSRLPGSRLVVTPSEATLNGAAIGGWGSLWTVPANVSRMRVRLWGGGGGGGGSVSSSGSAGSGGGGGGYAEGVFAVTAGQVLTITAGTAGAGGNGAGGYAGGTSSVGAFVSASGGGGGNYATGGGPSSIPGSGGAGYGGDVNISGSSGDIGTSVLGSGQYVAGCGGAAFGGPMTMLSIVTAAQAGNTGFFPGQGGGGGFEGAAGGAGAAGLVIVEF